VVNVWLLGVPLLVYGCGISLFRTAFSVQCTLSKTNCEESWTPPPFVPTPPPIKVQIDGYDSDGYTYPKEH
jgi:hypothetical protein